jgi:hypothetical protein
MYEEVAKSFIDFQDSILNLVKEIINDTVLKANKEKLNPIQTYIIMTSNIEKALLDVKNICDIENPITVPTDNKIFLLIKPYYDVVEKYLKKLTDKIPESCCLKDYIDISNEISQIIYPLNEWGFNPQEMSIDIKKHLK